MTGSARLGKRPPVGPDEPTGLRGAGIAGPGPVPAGTVWSDGDQLPLIQGRPIWNLTHLARWRLFATTQPDPIPHVRDVGGVAEDADIQGVPDGAIVRVPGAVHEARVSVPTGRAVLLAFILEMPAFLPATIADVALVVGKPLCA